VATELAAADWSLVLLGDGPLRRVLEQKIEESGLGGLVRMPGFKQYDDLPAFYGLADGFALVSHSETWGLVVNEALAAGLPAVVSDACGCVPELMSGGEAGFVCSPQDSGSIATALRRLFSLTPDERQRMGQAGRRRVAEYGLEFFADGLWRSAELALRHGAPPVAASDRLLALVLARYLRRRHA
jgi:glycosyltransferase involved in cell wall biosynthesis